MDSADNQDCTPLHWAARHENGRILQALIRAKAQLNTLNKNREWPLYLAVTGNKPEAVELLLEAGADPQEKDNEERSLLEIAVKRGYSLVVSSLLKYGASIQIQNAEGKSLVQLAAEKNHFYIIKMLIAMGAPILYAKTEEGVPLLIYAATIGDEEFVRLLLKAGASADTRGERNNTPLHHAVLTMHLRIAENVSRSGSRYK